MGYDTRAATRHASASHAQPAGARQAVFRASAIRRAASAAAGRLPRPRNMPHMRRTLAAASRGSSARRDSGGRELIPSFSLYITSTCFSTRRLRHASNTLSPRRSQQLNMTSLMPSPPMMILEVKCYYATPPRHACAFSARLRARSLHSRPIATAIDAIDRTEHRPPSTPDTTSAAHSQQHDAAWRCSQTH